jgi:hypothetical protein
VCRSCCKSTPPFSSFWLWATPSSKAVLSFYRNIETLSGGGHEERRRPVLGQLFSCLVRGDDLLSIVYYLFSDSQTGEPGMLLNKSPALGEVGLVVSRRML